MNRHYPLWNVTARELFQVLRGQRLLAAYEDQVGSIILYHLQRAAINSDWEVFRIMVEHRMRTNITSEIAGEAVYIAHLNGNYGLAQQLFLLYSRRIYATDPKGYLGIIRYYTLRNYPHRVAQIFDQDISMWYQTNMIPPILREYVINNPSARRKIRGYENYVAISGIISPDSEMQQEITSVFKREMLKYRAAHPDIPYDLLLFTFKSDVIDQTADQNKREILEREWMLIMSAEVLSIKYYNIRMIRSLNTLISNPNFPLFRRMGELVKKPILLKGSQAVWNIFRDLPDKQKREILDSVAVRIAYLQRLNRPVSMSTLILDNIDLI